MAESPVGRRLTAWIGASGFRPQSCRTGARLTAVDPGPLVDGATGDEPSAPSSTLITYLPGIAAEAVADAVLASVRPRLWLNLTPMPVDQALGVSDRVTAASVDFVHAPYVADPSDHERPACVVYDYGPLTGTSRTSRTGVVELVRALSYLPEWVGPLASTTVHGSNVNAFPEWAGPFGSDAAPESDLNALAELALLHRTQPAL